MDSIPSLQHRNSQDPITSFSLSLPSEPPDVGNWFSSYEYKSPNSDSNVIFEDSAFKGCESEKDEEREEEVNCKKIRSADEVVAGEKLLRTSTYFEDDKHNEDLSLAKDLDTFSLHSVFLSEPPDIRNWFSSYVYESPMSGTSSHFEDSVSKENECEEKNLIFHEKEEHEVRCENVHPGESLTHNSSSDTNTRVNQLSSRDDGSVEMEKNISLASTSHLAKILQPCMRIRTLQHNASPTKCEETISLSHETAGCNREQTQTLLDMDKNCTKPPDSVLKNDMKEATSKAMIQHEHRGLNAARSADVFSERNSTWSREKENGDMVSMSGFVTTGRSRHGGVEDENCSKKTQEMSLQDSTKRGRDSLTCKKQDDMKRKALGEVTNLKICNGMDITGKWQCPQKGKPNVGPALKQLRLERWVHRN